MADDKLVEAGNQFSNEIQPVTQELFIAYENWKQNTAMASTSEDNPSNNARYRFEFHVKKPHMIIESTSGPTNPIAHVSYHNWSVKADVELYPSNGSTQKILIQPKSKLARKPEYKYASPSLGGTNVTWQTQGSLNGYFDFVLMDESAMPLARFKAAGIRGNWSMKKVGKLELMPAISDKVEVVDELVTTLMTILYYHLMQINPTGTAAAAAASSSSSSAAAATVS